MKIEVLDHGYVELVEFWGSDERIIEAARMSTNKGFVSWESDTKLLKYLYTHGHTSPFEHCGLTLEMYAPLMVVREWQRHRTQSYNELSGRYTTMPEEYYLPSEERIKPQAKLNRQDSEGELPPNIVYQFRLRTERGQQLIRDDYNWAIEHGIAREVARINTPLSNYTKFRSSANLKNWLDFLSKRLPVGAQAEIRDYAAVVSSIVKETFPRTWELFNEHTQN